MSEVTSLQAHELGATELVHLRANVCNTTATAVGPVVTPKFTLSAPYPNPIQAGATVDFSLDRDETVSIHVYDVSGRRVRTLLESAIRGSGPGSVTFATDGLASGVYFITLRTPARSVSRKLTLVK